MSFEARSRYGTIGGAFRRGVKAAQGFLVPLVEVRILAAELQKWRNAPLLTLVPFVASLVFPAAETGTQVFLVDWPRPSGSLSTPVHIPQKERK